MIDPERGRPPQFFEEREKKFSLGAPPRGRAGRIARGLNSGNMVVMFWAGV